MDVSWMPPDTDEKKAHVEKFREKSGNPDNLKILLQTTEEAKKLWSGVKAWGAFGLCWGGKVRIYLQPRSSLSKTFPAPLLKDTVLISPSSSPCKLPVQILLLWFLVKHIPRKS